MSRPLRIQYEDAYYHVMNRGRGRQRIFYSESYCHDFLQCLEEAHRRFGIEIHAYCLMSNHYHLLIKTPRANLSRAMRHIDGVYTQRHNRRKQTDGPLFRGRYKAIVIDASSYLLQVSRYIHRNPIETRKPLVARLEDYRWSSYRAYLNQTPAPGWLNRDTVYAELGSRHRYAAYRAYVEQGNEVEIARFYRRQHTPAMLGDAAFRESAYRKALCLDAEVDKRGIREPVSIERVIARVANHFGVSTNEIKVARRGKGRRNVARALAMKLCQELGDGRLRELAQIFNVGHYSTISQTIGRLNRQMQSDNGLLDAYNMLSQGLTL